MKGEQVGSCAGEFCSLAMIFFPSASVRLCAGHVAAIQSDFNGHLAQEHWSGISRKTEPHSEVTEKSKRTQTVEVRGSISRIGQRD